MNPETSVLKVGFTVVRQSTKTGNPKPWWLHLLVVPLVAIVILAITWWALKAGKDVTVQVGSEKGLSGKVEVSRTKELAAKGAGTPKR